MKLSLARLFHNPADLIHDTQPQKSASIKYESDAPRLGQDVELVSKKGIHRVFRTLPDETPLDDPTSVPSIDELRPRPREHTPEYEMSRHREHLLANINLEDDIDENLQVFLNEVYKYMWIPEKKDSPMLARGFPRIRALDQYGLAEGVGARKTSKAKVWLKPGTGKIVVNGVPFTEYFSIMQHRSQATDALYTAGLVGQVDIYAKVRGGGHTGQADAMCLAIARAIQDFDPRFRPVLRLYGYLTRDPRMVERKKTGQKKARKKFTWVKR